MMVGHFLFNCQIQSLLNNNNHTKVGSSHEAIPSYNPHSALPDHRSRSPNPSTPQPHRSLRHLSTRQHLPILLSHLQRHPKPLRTHPLRIDPLLPRHLPQPPPIRHQRSLLLLPQLNPQHPRMRPDYLRYLHHQTRQVQHPSTPRGHSLLLSVFVL